MEIRKSHAVVLLSGGMDSVIALYWAIFWKEIKSIDVLCIDYGQRHSLEVQRARDVFNIAKQHPGGEQLQDFRVAALPRGLILGASSILGSEVPVSEYENVAEAQQHNQSDTSYIPARNTIFIALAANQLLSTDPAGGIIVTGFRGRVGPGGGFPDGSPQFADAMTNALGIGCFGGNNREKFVVVWDPLNRPGRSRLDALKMASELKGCWDALAYSMTCFNGTEPPCGKCLPCLRREEGFKQFGKPDPLIERLERAYV